MGGIFFALVFAGWVPAALLIVGVALAILATVLYAADGACARSANARRKPPPRLHNLQPELNLWPERPIIAAQRPTEAKASRSRSEMEDTFPDLGSLSDEELKDLIDKLTNEENEISYKRRVLHGKIDILRAELVNRLRHKHESGDSLISGDDVAQLTDILAGKAQSPPEDDTAA